jgi:hypothetical protein
MMAPSDALREAARLLDLAATWDDPADVYETPDLVREAIPFLETAIREARHGTRTRKCAREALQMCREELRGEADRRSAYCFNWNRIKSHSDILAVILSWRRLPRLAT